MFTGKIRNADLVVEQRHRATLPITIFEDDVRQVLNNLIGNAIDATAPGGRILIRSKEGVDWQTGRPGITIIAADTGSGMSPSVLKKVFEAFYTTKGSKGTGLGLWISKDIVDRQKGAHKVRSSQAAQHRGTVITLFLPHAS